LRRGAPRGQAHERHEHDWKLAAADNRAHEQGGGLDRGAQLIVRCLRPVEVVAGFDVDGGAAGLGVADGAPEGAALGSAPEEPGATRTVGLGGGGGSLEDTVIGAEEAVSAIVPAAVFPSPGASPERPKRTIAPITAPSTREPPRMAMGTFERAAAGFCVI